MTVHDLRFHRFSASQGELRFEADRVKAYYLGGARLDVAVEGSSRFPLATLDCGGCAGPEHETLVVQGRVDLKGLVADEGNRLRGAFSGDFAFARIDEAPIDPAALLGTGVVALGVGGVGAALLLKLILAPFFTRLTKEQALEHPRRRQIFDYIHDHPGANFREVARNTGIAAGTVRHHLNVLERSGQVVEHPHGSTVRLFENHGKFDHTWSDMVLLREPALGKLHAWLKANPGSPQKAVLEAMEAEGWSRSTTQHRLSRLVEGGVASIRLQGRLKLYSVAERGAVAKPGFAPVRPSGPGFAA